MPSSLTVNLSSALVCSTRPPVSVWGTGRHRIKFSGFSREPDYLHYRLAARARRTLPFQHPRRICLPRIYLRGLTHYSVSARECHFSVSTITPMVSNGMLTVSSIGCALRLFLRSRLTLIRLALIRNPWSCGGEVSRLPCRYLYLHLLFRCLQSGSRLTFCGSRNAPLPISAIMRRFHVFGTGLMPDYYPCGITRLVSCYALFK